MAIDQLEVGGGFLADAYGRHVVAGVLVQRRVVTSGSDKTVHLKLLLGRGEWDSVELVAYDGVVIDPSNYTFHPGTVSTGSADPLQGADTRFPDTIYHSGRAYITITLPPGIADEVSPDKVAIVAKTRKVAWYDNTGTEIGYGYSTNPADHFVDQIKRNLSKIGKTLSGRIDWPAYVTARNYYAGTLNQDDYTKVPSNFKAGASSGGTIPTGQYLVSIQAKSGTDYSLRVAEQVVIFQSGSQSVTYQFNPVSGITDYVIWVKDGSGNFYRTDLTGVTDPGDGNPYSGSFSSIGTSGTPSAAGGVFVVSRPRFESHLAWTQPTGLNQSLNDICMVCCSDWQRDGRVYRILPPTERTPVFHFDASNTMPGSFQVKNLNKDERQNRVTINFRDVMDPYNSVANPPVAVDRHESQAKSGIIEAPFDLSPMSRNQANRVANYQIRLRHDLPNRLTFKDDGSAPHLLPSDVVTVSDTNQGWDHKQFQILEILDDDSRSGGSRTYTLSEYVNTIYSDSDVTPIVTTKPTDVTSVFSAPAAPISLGLAQETIVSADDVVNLQVRGTVDFAPFIGRQRGLVYIKRPGDSDYTYLTVIDPNPDTGIGGFRAPNLLLGLHYFKVIPVSSVGVTGDEIVGTITVTAPAAPATPTGYAILFASAGVGQADVLHHKWNGLADYIYEVSATSDFSTLLYRGPANQFFEPQPDRLRGGWTRYLRAKKYGVYSSFTSATSASVIPTRPSTTRKSTTSYNVVFTLTTPSSAEALAQINETEFQVASDSGFTTILRTEKRPGIRSEIDVSGTPGQSIYFRSRFNTIFGDSTSWSDAFAHTFESVGDLNGKLGNLYWPEDDTYNIGIGPAPSYTYYRPANLEVSRRISVSGGADPEISLYVGRGNQGVRGDVILTLDGSSVVGTNGLTRQEFRFDGSLRWYWQTDHQNEDIVFRDNADREYIRFVGGDGLSTPRINITPRIGTNLLPFTTNTFDLGSSTYKWRNGTFAGTVDAAAFTLNGAPFGISGTTNYVSKFTSASGVGNSQIFDNGTNVGIGTTTLNHKLEVNGSIGLGLDAWLRGTTGTSAIAHLIRARGAGYGANAYPGVQIGEPGNHIALFVDPGSVAGGSFSGITNEIFLPNVVNVLQVNTSGNNWLASTMTFSNGVLGVANSTPFAGAKMTVGGSLAYPTGGGYQFKSVLDASYNGVTPGAIVIDSPIGRTSNLMFKVRVHGYLYGAPDNNRVIDFTFAGYTYGAVNGPDGLPGDVISRSFQDNGNDGQPKYFGINSSGKVSIAYGDPTMAIYIVKLIVDVETMYGTAPDLATGWSVRTSSATNYDWLHSKTSYGTHKGFRSDIVGATVGFQINGAAASGQYLRGNGTNFVSSAIQAGDLPIGVSGTLNYLAKFTPSGAVVGNSQLFDNGTNIGINTTSPTEKFQVMGNIRQGDSTNPRGYNLLQHYMALGETEGSASSVLANNAKVVDGISGTLSTLVNASDGSNWLRLNYAHGLSFHKYGAASVGTQFAETSNQLFRIDLNGFMALGSHTPSAVIHAVGVQGIMQSTNAAWTLWKDGTPTIAAQTRLSGDDLFIGVYNPTDNWQYPFRITNSTRRVGIGVGVNPAAQLDVAGTFRITPVTTAALPAASSNDLNFHRVSDGYKNLMLSNGHTWYSVHRNRVSLYEFNGKPNDAGFDNSAAFAAALAALPAVGGVLEIGPGDWYFSSTITISKQVRVIGSGTYRPSRETTAMACRLLFPAGVAGIVVNVEAAGSTFMHFTLQGLGLFPTAGSFSANACGFDGKANGMLIEDVGVQHFRGHGFRFDTTSSGNTNCSRVSKCLSYYNAGDGFHAKGQDSNLIHFDVCDAGSNRGRGYSNIGTACNKFTNPHAAFNEGGDYYDASSSPIWTNVYAETPPVGDPQTQSFTIASDCNYLRFECGIFGAPNIINNNIYGGHSILYKGEWIQPQFFITGTLFSKATNAAIRTANNTYWVGTRANGTELGWLYPVTNNNETWIILPGAEGGLKIWDSTASSINFQGFDNGVWYSRAGFNSPAGASLGGTIVSTSASAFIQTLNNSYVLGTRANGSTYGSFYPVTSSNETWMILPGGAGGLKVWDSTAGSVNFQVLDNGNTSIRGSLTISGLTANRAIVSGSSGLIEAATATKDQINALAGLSNNLIPFVLGGALTTNSILGFNGTKLTIYNSDIQGRGIRFGSTNYAFLLEQPGDSNYLRIRKDDTLTTDIIAFTPSGVGIGTNSPTEKLDVMGNVLSSGKITLGINEWLEGRTGTTPVYQNLIRARGMGYDPNTYGGVQVGTVNSHIALFIDPGSITGSAFNGNLNEILLPNSARMLQANSGGTNWNHSTPTMAFNDGMVSFGIDSSAGYKVRIATASSVDGLLITNSIGQARVRIEGTTFGQIDNGVGDFYLTNASATGSLLLRTNNTIWMRMGPDGKTNFGPDTSASFNLSVNQATNTTSATLSTYGFALLNQGTANLTLGSDASYNHIQSWASKPLVLNSQGNSVLIPASFLRVGSLTAPTERVDVVGNVKASGNFIGTSAVLSAQASAGDHAIRRDYLLSRGTQLITNGNGSLGNNTNFSQYTFDATDAGGIAIGSFYPPMTAYTGIYSDEFVPVDTNKFYELSVWGKSGDVNGSNYNAANRQYLGYVPYDADFNVVDSYHGAPKTGTTTTLAAALNPGDTTITLTSSTGWEASNALAYWRQLVWYPYVNSKGYVYGDYGYSRNMSFTLGSYATNGLWAVGGISGNVITLTAPWSGPALANGTKVANIGFDGGTFIYNLLSYGAIPNTWTKYATRMGGGVGFNTDTTKFRNGTAYIKPLLLVNYHGTADNRVRLANWNLIEVPTRIGGLSENRLITQIGGIIVNAPNTHLTSDSKLRLGNSAAPSYRLHVEDSTSSVVVLQNNSGTAVDLRFMNTTSNSGFLQYSGTGWNIFANNTVPLQLRPVDYDGHSANASVDIRGAMIRIGDIDAAATMTNGVGIKFLDAGVAHASIKFLPSPNRMDFGNSSSSAHLQINSGAETLTLDFANIRAGIGTTAPSTALEVRKNSANYWSAGTWGGSTTPEQALTVTNSAPSSGGAFDSVLLFRQTTSASSILTAAAINVTALDVWSATTSTQTSAMQFMVRNSSGVLTNVLQINPTGVGITGTLSISGSPVPTAAASTASRVAKWGGSNSLTTSNITDDGAGIGLNQTTPTSRVHTGGSLAHTVTKTTVNLTLTVDHHIVLADTTSAGVTITLPTAVGIEGRTYTVVDWKGQAVTNNVTLATTSSQTINGTATKVINTAYGTLRVISDGANWVLIPA